MTPGKENQGDGGGGHRCAADEGGTSGFLSGPAETEKEINFQVSTISTSVQLSHHVLKLLLKLVL